VGVLFFVVTLLLSESQFMIVDEDDHLRIEVVFALAITPSGTPATMHPQHFFSEQECGGDW